MSTELWSVGALGDVSYVEMGQSPLSEFVSDTPGRGMAFLQGNAEFTDRFPRPRLWCTRPRKVSKAGDILISVRAPVGAINRADQDYCIGRGLAAVRFTGIDPDYGYHALAEFSPALHRLAQGTTFDAIGGDELRGLTLHVCHPREQRRIAEILNTLDDAIRRTGQLLAKLDLMKLGFLQDLLTRGIDEKGELRELQQSPTRVWGSPGWGVPNDWTVRQLSDTCSLIRDGTHLPPPRVNDGPLLLSVRNLHNGELVVRDDDTRVPWSFYRRMHTNWQIKRGDVLLAIVGATLGKCARVGDLPPFTLQRSVAVLRGSDRLDNDFLAYVVESVPFQNRLWQLANQTAQPGLYLDSLGSIRVPIPALDEQLRIAEHLRSLRKRIDEETAFWGKLARVKHGLMGDLLTGRVRATGLLNGDAS